jgi:hypothetical protein
LEKFTHQNPITQKEQLSNKKVPYTAKTLDIKASKQVDWYETLFGNQKFNKWNKHSANPLSKQSAYEEKENRNLICRARLKHSAASLKSLSLMALDPFSIKSSANSNDFSRSPSDEPAAALLLLLQVDSVPPWALDSMVAWVARAFGAAIVTEVSDADAASTIALFDLGKLGKWDEILGHKKEEIAIAVVN